MGRVFRVLCYSDRKVGDRVVGVKREEVVNIVVVWVRVDVFMYLRNMRGWMGEWLRWGWRRVFTGYVRSCLYGDCFLGSLRDF